MTDEEAAPDAVEEHEALVAKVAEERLPAPVIQAVLDGILRIEVALTQDDSAIRVWRFEDAPEELRALSQHDGDELWVAWIPAEGEWPTWAWEGTAFGDSVEEWDLPDGSRALIGATE